MRAHATFCRSIGTVLLCILASSLPAWSQAAEVSIPVTVTNEHGHGHENLHRPSEVVAWLVPLSPGAQLKHGASQQQFTLTQKDKQFKPHVMVVPTGSSVDFPNLDPFFHNVFSLFNGKRFDLGLYEAHTHKFVKFDREGVSYIFCNIHPQMGAVIISLDTPYYGTSNVDGVITIRNIPKGSYRLQIWAENVTNERLSAVTRTVEISSESERLPAIALQSSGDLMEHHLNKFGTVYRTTQQDPY